MDLLNSIEVPLCADLRVHLLILGEMISGGQWHFRELARWSVQSTRQSRVRGQSRTSDAARVSPK